MKHSEMVYVVSVIATFLESDQVSVIMYLFKDMSHVVGKNRKELLAMAKVHNEDKKGL